jgi:hypothetical protein
MHAVQHKHKESSRTGQGLKAWTMVADADSLLDDESRKSIILLRGIKGTHLIIPQIGKFIENIVVSNASFYCVTECLNKCASLHP